MEDRELHIESISVVANEQVSRLQELNINLVSRCHLSLTYDHITCPLICLPRTDSGILR